MLFHGIYELNENPRIISLYGDDAMQHVKNTYHPDQGPLYFLWHCAWYQGRLRSMIKLKYQFATLKKLGITPLLITNTDKEESLRKSMGLPGLQCITYIFTDENDYSAAEQTRDLDAIYTAQMLPFKRLELAAQIERLYILTYKPGTTVYDLHAEYPMLQHADYNRDWVGPAEKGALYNRAEVGLCLSKEEGAMLASLEYMLSGLPVVSTPSLGGRDTYYDPAFTLIVEPEAKQVREAVEEMKNRHIDRTQIRAKTIAHMRRDRERFTQFICDYVGKDSGVRLEPEALYAQMFDAPRSRFEKLKALV
jgi:glycosyltransferase involved in cell wall biosynthesis